MKKIINTELAPKAIGPYSQAIETSAELKGELLFISGQLPVVPETGKLASGSDEISAQAHQSLKNIQSILMVSGKKLSDVVKTTVYLKDMNDFEKFNKVYCQYFTGDFPARSCFQVAKLPQNALVEIEAIAE
jgi:2-iminobutanoate/2-iminopropanoate deaminase